MKTKHTKKLIICLAILSLLVMTPLSSAKVRSSYLVDFISDNRISDSEGFTNVIQIDGSISYEATYYALDILHQYNNLRSYVDPELLGENLGKAIDYIIEYQSINLHKLYYLLSSINILGQMDQVIKSNSSLNGKIIDYLNQTAKISGGFTMTNISSSTSDVISTYFGIKNYELIDEPLTDATTHMNWISLLCYNSNDGGFGGNSTLSSTQSTTYYATLALHNLDSLDNLTTHDNILQYAKDFYLSIGGYKPDKTAQQPLLSSTYYSVKIISMIDSSYNDKTSSIEWILDQQNMIDGGFSNPSTQVGVKNSSIISSYYGFNALRELNALSYLNSNIGIVEFNWYILLGVLVVIGFAFGLVFYLWKKRQI